jgi:predicted transcriptional regulator
LREELQRLSQEPEQYYDNHRAEVAKLEQANQKLQDEKRELQRNLDTQEQLEYDQERLQTKFNSLEVRYEAVIADNNKLKETLDRVSPSYKDQQILRHGLEILSVLILKKFVPRRRKIY